MTASAVLTPSMRPDVAEPAEGWTSVEWIESRLEVMSSTRELMCLAEICGGENVSASQAKESQEED